MYLGHEFRAGESEMSFFTTHFLASTHQTHVYNCRRSASLGTVKLAWRDPDADTGDQNASVMPRPTSSRYVTFSNFPATEQCGVCTPHVEAAWSALRETDLPKIWSNPTYPLVGEEGLKLWVAGD